MQNAWERGEMLTELESKDLNGRDHLGYLCVDNRIILNWTLNDYDIT
jgi:hypothetical protein